MTAHVSIVEVINAIATLILSGLIAWSKFKTDRSIKHDGLCGSDIEHRLQTIGQELNHLKWSIEDVRERVMKLEMSVEGLKK